jgi:hypothetical protein
MPFPQLPTISSATLLSYYDLRGAQSTLDGIGGSFTNTDGARVYEWEDHENDNDMTGTYSASATDVPKYGTGTYAGKDHGFDYLSLDHDTEGDSLLCNPLNTSPSSGEYTVALVVKIDSEASAGDYDILEMGDQDLYYYQAGGQVFIGPASGGVAPSIALMNVTQTGWNSFIIKQKSGTTRCMVNNGLVAGNTGASGTCSKIGIGATGANNNADFEIAFLIVYDGYMDEADMLRLNYYMDQRFFDGRNMCLDPDNPPDLLETGDGNQPDPPKRRARPNRVRPCQRNV